MKDDADTVQISTWHRCLYDALRCRYTNFRLQLINLKHSAENYWFTHRAKTEIFAWTIIIAVLVPIAKFAHAPIQPFLRNEQFVDTLSGTALTLGSSLLGATAIVAALVLFAMQVNVERLPHGLFQRLSSDKPLLISFAVSFVASIIIACLPLITPVQFTEWAILGAVLLTMIILRLFLAAYRRSLDLINPLEQLRIVVSDTTVALKRWGNQADWFSATFPRNEPEEPTNPLIDSTVDTKRAAFMLQNDWGSRVVRRDLNHCMSVNSRAASQGDYRVAQESLTAVVIINASYLHAKGKTFFAENGISEVPFATDPVVNSILEGLKRQFRVAVGRRDEEHVNMLLKAYGELAQLYAQIDYGRPEAGPWHAQLAIRYLNSDIKSIIPQNLPDSMMQGIRVLGGCATALLNRDKATEIVSIVDQLGPIGAAMMLREDHHPVTITAVEQLAGLTYHMINAGVFDPGFTFGRICDAVELIAKIGLDQPNPTLTSVHRSALAPYFSPTVGSSLSPSLKRLINTLLECPAENESAKKCGANLLEWAERTRTKSKDIMQLAIEKRSPFVFDILHWIGDIVEVLLAAATAPVSREFFGPELEKQAERWALILTWIPDDTESMDCASAGSVTAVMFEIAAAARKWKSEVVYDAAQRNLLRWALLPARRENAWHEAEEAMLALAAVAIESPSDLDGAAFKAQLAKALQAEKLPSADLLLGTAQGIMRSIDDYDQDLRRTRGWDHILRSLEHKDRRRFLTELARILEGAIAGRSI